MLPPPPRSTLFPYTTLFRSDSGSLICMKLFPPGSPRWILSRKRIFGKTKKSNKEKRARPMIVKTVRSEEHTSELQSRRDLVCRLLLEKKKKKKKKKK